MKKRIITTETLEEDQKIEGSLRPQYLEDYIGQTKAKETLKIYIEAAKARGEARLTMCSFTGLRDLERRLLRVLSPMSWELI